MKPPYSSSQLRAILVVTFVSILALHGALLPVSLSDPQITAPASGAGDSSSPIISADGRFVVFASTANNLVLNSNGVPFSSASLPVMNVYLRDRDSGTTALVSVNKAGSAGGNGDSWPRGVSTNGQFVLFESAANNLVLGDSNNQYDVFVRDMVGGTTTLVSVNTNGVSGNGYSRDSVLTPDGRLVAFASFASDLVTTDTNWITDVFVRDLQSSTTLQVSAAATETNLYYKMRGAGASLSPSITPDGRYIAFFSTATNVVPGLQLSGDVYVCDLLSNSTTWASAAARSIAQALLGTTNVISYQPAISDDGQDIAFQVRFNANPGTNSQGLILRYNVSSGLTDIVSTNVNIPYQNVDNTHNLTMSPDGRFIAFIGNASDALPGTTGVYLWDANTGSNTLVSADPGGNVATNAICAWPSVDSTGRYVTFLSSATNLTANPLLGDFHLFIHDMQTTSTSLVDKDSNGIGTGVSWEAVPSLTSDVRFVAFEAPDGDLVPNDSNGRSDVFVRDVVAQTNELISVRDSSLSSLTPDGDSAVQQLAVSQDGRFVGLCSGADNLSPLDHNDLREVYVRDLLANSNILVSVDTNGIDAGDGVSLDPSISGDGRFVAFTSYAGNLVPGDTNNSQDVFVRDLQTGQTTAVSVSADGSTLGNTNSFSPTISADGRFVLYHSKAQNLASGSFGSGIENLFVRDLQLGTNYALTKAGSGAGVTWAAMTPDGHYVGLVGQVATSGQGIYVWDTLAGANLYTNFPVAAVTAFSISPNGQWLAYSTYLGLTLLNVPAMTSTYLSSGMPPGAAHGGIQFSSDAHWLVYSIGTSTAGTNQVFLYDTIAATNLLVSQSYGGGSPASGNSDDPAISPDGRFIVFRSTSTNLIAGITNGAGNLFVYDRLMGATSLLTTTSTGNDPASNLCLAPVFSGDGTMVFFRSFASELQVRDFNQSGDVLGYAFLYLSISASVTPGSGPTLSWPVSPGESYSVQYKNNLSDSSWQPVAGTITTMGFRGSLTDLAPASGQRFYHVVATQP